MRRCTVLVMLALLLSAGCESIRGPFQPKPKTRIDDPNLPIADQERRGRDRMGYPDKTSVLPNDPGLNFPR